jgi:putative endonuclease
MQNQALGKSGEDLTSDYLLSKGYEIIKRNYRCPYGEIDIIAIDRHYLVFIEVKTRTTQSLDQTKWDISLSKQRKLTRAALCFTSNYQNTSIREFRFDVIIIKKDKAQSSINHLIDAFPPAEVGEFFA